MSSNTTSWEYTYDSPPPPPPHATTINNSNNYDDNDGGHNLINNNDYVDNEETTTISFTSSYHSSSQQHQCSWSQEPIVVGYAFGPKKMSTMGVVMAEASRAEVIHEEPEEDFIYFEQQQQQESHEQEQQQHQAEDHEEDHDESLLHSSSSSDLHIEPQSPEDACLLTSANLEGFDNGNNEGGDDARYASRKEAQHQLLQEEGNSSSSLGPNNQQQQQHQQRPHTIISMASDMGDIKHIVRYFRSNCSSAAGSITETTVSTPTVRSSSTANNRSRKQSPVRISFVPLDPNISLQEQHGGKFDLILHKLTEDILSIAMDDKLCINQNFNKQQQQKQKQSQSSTIHTAHTTTTTSHTQNNNIDDSRSRVQSLLDYKKCNACCCLVDDPNHVQTLMNRSDISKTLQKCLQNVSSASGYPVRTPKFVVVDDDKSDGSDRTCSPRNKRLKQHLEEAQLHVPLIVKPLIAAGTKQSHYMTIILQESALTDSPELLPDNNNNNNIESSGSSNKIPPKSLIQQYENHNATLYKVYVMGENVHVYQRPSLPDLPTDTTQSSIDLLEFDSQRPYPRLHDFGFETDTNTSSKEKTGQEEPSSTPLFGNLVDADVSRTTGTTGSNSNNSNIEVTPDEVRPIVEALKEAFGLELFGFDILISSTSSTTKSNQQQQQWLVVDVNYFPSYKEVPNFPALLAQYLTNRVLHQRRRTLMLQQRRQEDQDSEEKGEYVDHPRENSPHTNTTKINTAATTPTCNIDDDTLTGMAGKELQHDDLQ